MSIVLTERQHDVLHELRGFPLWRGAFHKATVAARIRHEFVIDKDGTVYITESGKKWLDAAANTPLRAVTKDKT